MKIKLDENLPESLLATLKALGHDVDNVTAEGLAGRADFDVWQAAQKAERFLSLRIWISRIFGGFLPARIQGLMLVRLRTPGRSALATRIAAVFREENSTAWARCFVLLTDHKLRVHTPSR